MWTHYTGNYAGIRIEYYARRLLEALPDDVNLVRMGYDDVPPRVSGKDTREMQAAARKILSQKKYNWSYEREWRVLGPVGKVQINSPDVVRSIYLGSRIQEEHRTAVLKAFENSNADIYEMDVDGYNMVGIPYRGHSSRDACRPEEGSLKDTCSSNSTARCFKTKCHSLPPVPMAALGQVEGIEITVRKK
jgi:hypothetical protein